MSRPPPLSDCSDETWDAFLRTHPEGQFQQSAAWARVKAREGWACERRVLLRDGAVAGGFQVLWKASSLGRIGYVSKGPAIAKSAAPEGDDLIRPLTALARDLRLRALLVQPPDESQLSPDTLSRHGFFTYPVPSVIRTTGLIPLADGEEAVLKRMDRQARREGRVAEKRGVRFRWGTRDDLPAFFDLMRESAQRQGSSPNPSRLELLQALWDALPGHVRLGLSDFEGKAIAGLLLVAFGNRLTLWKKGWKASDPHLFANCHLNTEALLWGARSGFAYADFVGMAPEVAETLLRGERLSETQNRGRDRFNLRLGAEPRRLPPAQLHVTQPLMRALLRTAACVPSLRRFLMGQVRT